jgi:hypothetical protein
VVERGYMREVAYVNKANQVTFEQLQGEKANVKAKLYNIKMAHSMLKDQAQGLTLELEFREKHLKPFMTRWFP